MKRIIAVLLTALLVCGMTAVQAAEPDGYIATGGIISDTQVYTGSWQQAYLQIVNNHSAWLYTYQSRTLEYWADGADTPLYIPFRPVALTDLTADGVPELIFLEERTEDRGDLYIYSWNGSSVRCALYVPGIARLGANDVDFRYVIYLSSDAGGTLVIEYDEYDFPWVLQLARNALNQYSLVNYLYMEYDNSGEADDDLYILNGAQISMEKYYAALNAMRNGKTQTVTDYLAGDLSHYGLEMTWEDAAAVLYGSGAGSGDPMDWDDDGGESYGGGLDDDGPGDDEIFGLAINRLSTRKGPGTQYAEGGTYNVKGQYIQILGRAYDKRNGIWWVKCVIPYHNKERILWTGYKRFDHDQLPLEIIPIEEGW